MNANPRPKFKLRPGLRKTNVDIVRDGKTLTETLVPGGVYEGDEYHRWVPRILVPIDSTVKVENLKVPEPPPHRRGLRRMRRTLAPEQKPGMAMKATMEKKHVTRRPRPADVAPKPPPKKEAPKPEEKKAEAPDPKAAEKARLEAIYEKIGDMKKPDLAALIKKEGWEEHVGSRDTVPTIKKKLKTLITKTIKAL